MGITDLWKVPWGSLTFLAEAGCSGRGSGHRRHWGLLGRLLLFHPGVLRSKGARRYWAAVVAIWALFGSAVARVAAWIQAGDGLFERRRNKCRV